MDSQDKQYRVIEVKQSVFAANDRQADELRTELKARGSYLLNLMSSPGAGKTTTLSRTIETLGSELALGIMEADIDSDVDAATIARLGAKVIQLHTGGMCHLDAGMTRQGLESLGAEGLDLIVLENVGNLVCPAEFDTGAVKNAVIASVPEGDDKPLKYPLMFEVCDVVLVNKMDVAPYFTFDLQRFTDNVHLRNPRAQVIPISAISGEGMEPWYQWLRDEVSRWQAPADA
jgi:hydrogenase nickel incorporation protein HypB